MTKPPSRFWILQLPPKVKALGFFAASAILFAMLLISLQLFVLTEPNNILMGAIYCVSALGGILLLAFLFLLGMDVIKRIS